MARRFKPLGASVSNQNPVEPIFLLITTTRSEEHRNRDFSAQLALAAPLTTQGPPCGIAGYADFSSVDLPRATSEQQRRVLTEIEKNTTPARFIQVF